MIEVEFLKKLSPARRDKIMARSTADFSETMAATAEILARLKAEPEAEMLREYGPLKDGFTLADLLVTEEEIEKAFKEVPAEIIQALETAAANIFNFHQAQLERPMWFDEFAPGLIAGRMTKALSNVGVYIPGGRAAYPSSALMNIIPARAAGVEKIVAATPPGPGLKVRPEILVGASLAGADAIYKLGGAWAVGSLAYGLAGLPRVDKIVGPGSAWVTAAKMSVFGQVDIDMPAGPSEGFIIADKTAEPQWLAWDLLSQLEHDPQSAAVLVSTDEALAMAVAAAVKDIFPTLERKEIVAAAIKNGAAVLVAENLYQAIDFANDYAPEHLQLAVADPFTHLTRVQNAGSVFLGPNAPIAAGDYASGPNHVLPTGFAARAFSGLSADSFLKKITFQHLSKEALADLAPTVTTLARAEGLPAHAG
ncbi:histidinol dehydrogenase, partial [Deltaproteobacteria bacterium OttesenSCG-928-K17]|nr:histidinol dehydrogenase [Deltaproteobacteria bacterium OttesenSCG-928-K17]